MAAGMQLKSSAGVKAGPKNPSAPNQMTRAEFVAFKQKASQNAAVQKWPSEAAAPSAQACTRTHHRDTCATPEEAGSKARKEQTQQELVASQAAATEAEQPMARSPQASRAVTGSEQCSAQAPATQAGLLGLPADVQLRRGTEDLPDWVQDSTLKAPSDQGHRLSRGQGSILASAPDFGQTPGGHYDPPAGHPMHKPGSEARKQAGITCTRKKLSRP
jgi:hypothetical protein